MAKKTITKRTDSTITNAVTWYTENRPIYELLSKKVEILIREIVDNSIPIHEINSRPKEINSFAKKIEAPEYNDPINQITDLAGIRIITYVESDLEKISTLIEDCFDIDIDNSIDKSKALGEDKVGYRSIHYVGKLPKERLKLPEYKKFENCCFEIQIRTILQHAWAEIEHDRNYKFSGELPPNLKRRFKVLAGVLELADREFNAIAHEIDEYSKSVDSDTKKGNLDLSIDSISLISFLNVKFNDLIKHTNFDPSFINAEFEKMVMNELKDFGITSIRELDEIIPADISEKYISYQINKLSYIGSYPGLLRNIMMVNNLDKYFESCWYGHFNIIRLSTIELLRSYHIDTDEIVKKYHLKIKN